MLITIIGDSIVFQLVASNEADLKGIELYTNMDPGLFSAISTQVSGHLIGFLYLYARFLHLYASCFCPR